MSSENENVCSYYTTGMPSVADTSTNSYETNSTLAQTTLRPNECIRIPSNQMAIIRNRSYDEIKAELPIKFEIDNLIGGQRFNLKDVTVDSQRGISPGQCSTESTSSTSSSPFRILPPKSNVNRLTPDSVKCLKCELCPFMSITQDGITSHMQNVHNSQHTSDFDASNMLRRKIKCPGCDNIFYTKQSLKIHLAKDHQMSAMEIMPLIDSLSKASTSSDGRPKKTVARKQKIYLRNVEVLKNPQFATNLVSKESVNMMSSQCTQNAIRLNSEIPIAHTNSAFGQIDNTMNMCETNADIQSNSTSIDERISISNSTTPSIDDLTNTRPDSGNSVQFVETTNTSNEWQINVNDNFTSFTSSATNWEYPTPRQTETYPIPSFNPCQNEKKKIYIRNIDILKEPLILTPGATTSSGRKQIHLRTVDEVNLMLSNRVFIAIFLCLMRYFYLNFSFTYLFLRFILGTK